MVTSAGSPAPPAGAESQSFVEAQPRRQHTARLVAARRRPPARRLLFEPAAQFQIASIGGDLVARPRPMGQQRLVRQPKLRAVDYQQPRRRIEKRVDQRPARRALGKLR